MNYNLFRINSNDFEHMVQSLMQKLLGDNSLVFGAGADGARELTYNGLANFPNTNSQWEGYWVVQAKYKNREDDTNDFEWVEKNFKKEMKKFSLKNKYKAPNNYIFLTNAILTPVLNEGGRDKIEVLKESYKNLIPNIFIGGNDELCRLLDNNRDVATSYYSFVLSGDVLSEVLQFFKRENNRINLTINIIKNYFEYEFKVEQNSKLIHAGDLAHTVNLENIFIDLKIKPEVHSSEDFYAINYIVNNGNNILRLSEKKEKLVLVGGAGAGKSTITQFTSQLYIACFLKYNLNVANDLIDNFINECGVLKISIPNCYRLPFKIILKDYAGWINERKGKEPINILSYIIFKIFIETGERLEINDLRDLLSKLSFIFIFDGLDEVPVSSNRDSVLKEINHFVDKELTNLNCDTIIIATTRPQGYTSEFDRNKYKHFQLTDMTNEICLTYLKKFLQNLNITAEKQKEYLNTLESSLLNEVTSNLMRTPLQATIMAVLVVSGGEPSSNKYSLFKEYYETIFKREKQKKVSPLINSYELQINKIHNYLGFKLQSDTENSSNTYSLLDINLFEKLIIEYLQDEEWTNEDINNFVDEFRKVITHRLVFISEVQDGKVGFIVRSLQEFFAANYYMDADDISVKERLRNISTNSYWRNTLLFSIGYLRVKKDHLLDDIYTLCCQMNGMDMDPSDSNYNNILKLGSWLALDVLSEGIFNDSPKLTNRFARLLESLFELPYQEDHTKMNRLQNRVKESYILDRFNTYSITTSTKPFQIRTIINIAVQLSNSTEKPLKNRALTFINNNISNLTLEYIIAEYYDNGFTERNFYPLFKQAFASYPISTFDYILTEGIFSKNKTTLKILKSINNEPVLKNKFIENLILIFIYSSYIDDEVDIYYFIQIINFISEKKLKVHKGILVDWSFLNICNSERDVYLFSTFPVTFYSVKRENRIILEILKDIALKHNINYIVSYFEYCLNPNKITLSKFYNNYISLPESFQKYFKYFDNDWALEYILRTTKNKSEFNSLISNLFPSDIIQTEDNLLKSDNAYQIYHYSNRATYIKVDLNNRSLLLQKLQLTINDETAPIEVKYELILYIFISLYRNIDKAEEETFLEESTVNYLLLILTNKTLFIGKSLEAWKSAWLILFNTQHSKHIFFSIEKTNCFELLIRDQIFRNQIEISEITIQNIINILNAFLNLKIANSIIRYATICIFGSRYSLKHRIYDYTEKIDFQSLSTINYEHIEDQICQFQLLFLSRNIINNDINFMLKFFEEKLSKLNNSFHIIIRVFTDLKLKGDWQTQLILLIMGRLSNDNSVYSDEYYFYSLKSFVESIPVSVSLKTNN